MNLENLFEDLENHYEVISARRAHGLENVGTITVRTGGHTLTLTQLHFAKDFTLGRAREALYVIPHGRLGVVDYQAGASTTSTINLKRWLESLPQATWLRIQVGGETIAGNMLFVQGEFLAVDGKLLPQRAIELIEMRAVENLAATSLLGATL